MTNKSSKSKSEWTVDAPAATAAAPVVADKSTVVAVQGASQPAPAALEAATGVVNLRKKVLLAVDHFEYSMNTVRWLAGRETSCTREMIVLSSRSSRLMKPPPGSPSCSSQSQKVREGKNMLKERGKWDGGVEWARWM